MHILVHFNYTEIKIILKLLLRTKYRRNSAYFH